MQTNRDMLGYKKTKLIQYVYSASRVEHAIVYEDVMTAYRTESTAQQEESKKGWP